MKEDGGSRISQMGRGREPPKEVVAIVYYLAKFLKNWMKFKKKIGPKGEGEEGGTHVSKDP